MDKSTKPTLADELLRENLVKEVNLLQEELLNEPISSPKRKVIGRKKQIIERKIHAIRPKKKPPGIYEYYTETARDILSKPIFDMIMNRAYRKMKVDKENGIT